MVKSITKTIVKKIKPVSKSASVVSKKASSVKTPKAVASKVPQTVKQTVSTTEGLSVSVYDQNGKKSSTSTLPKELFGQKINNQLLSQAVRVHLSNQRSGSASTKTRGEVEGSTRKIYNQKGTGRARHGSIRAHIFVGGGIVFGPRPRIFADKLPQKMKRKSLISALSSQCQSHAISIVAGLETLEPKTKLLASAIRTVTDAPHVLLVITKESQQILRTAKNIPYVHVLFADQLNAYDVLVNNHIIFTKDSLTMLKDFVAEK